MTAATSGSSFEVPTPATDHEGSEVAHVSVADDKAANAVDDSLQVQESASSCLGGPLFVLPKCVMPPYSEMAKVETFVENAIRDQDKLPDNSPPIKTYKGLVEAFRLKTDPDMLRKVLLALRTAGRGSTLHLLTMSSRKHARLIHQVLRLNPFEMPVVPCYQTPTTTCSSMVDCDLADAQLHFLMAVVSSNTVFLVPTLTFTWKLLTSQHENVPIERTQRCHAFLASLMRICPKAKSEIFPIISSNCPFRTKPEAEILWYYQQCLSLLLYLPALQTQVIDLLVDKCLEMDVEIKISELGEAVIDDDNDDECCFQLDLGDCKKKESAVDVTVDEMANKLDALMLLMFNYLSRSAEHDASSISVLYDNFARVFECSILICYKSKFVQFLIFYLCGLEDRTPSPEREVPDRTVLLYRGFCSKLISILLDPYRATATRQSGACYLASFVSRASFVSAETVCEAVSALLRWAEAYIMALDSSSTTVYAEDSREQCNSHSLFYTVCQSTFYIMCFRGVEACTFYQNAVASDAADLLQHIDISRDRWTRICSHSTEPLRFCLESVRFEFLALSRAHGLIDETLCDSLERGGVLSSSPGKRRKAVNVIRTAATLEKERRAGGVGGLGRGRNPLDSFFPFDPYLLRRSHSFIEPFYIHWCGVTGERSVALVTEDVPEDASSGHTTSDDEQSKLSNDSDTDSDGDDKVDQDDDYDEDQAHETLQPMSLASNAPSISTSSVNIVLSSPDVAVKREELRTAWTDTLKRSRASSIENGSW